jgi:MFS family permease
MPPTLNKSSPEEQPAAAEQAISRRTALWRDGRRSLRLLGTRVRRRVYQFTAGGRWTYQLPPSVRQNLRWFWFDGLFVSANDAIIVTYLSLFVLALGGTRAQIGLMSALSNLSAALLMFPGAALVERWGRRKQVVLLSGKGISHVATLLLVLVPLAFGSPAAVYIGIALAVARSAFANLGVPAWMSLTADIVPLSWRGRYFSARNVAMGIAQMVTTYFVGQLITRAGDPTGYQLAMGLAFAAGMASTFSYAHIEEPPPSATARATGRGSRASLLRHLRAHPDFLIFCTTAALWNLSLNIAGPFFNVYQVEILKVSAGVVGTLSVVSSLAALPGQRLFGPLVDRWGPRRVQLVTGLLIPLLPWAWVLVRSPWHVVPINLAGGFLWAGYNLASFSLLLTLTPEDRRPRYSAVYQAIVTAALAGGAALGGILAERWGYTIIFVLSGIGRLGAALLFALCGSRANRFGTRSIAPRSDRRANRWRTPPAGCSRRCRHRRRAPRRRNIGPRPGGRPSCAGRSPAYPPHRR